MVRWTERRYMTTKVLKVAHNYNQTNKQTNKYATALVKNKMIFYDFTIDYNKRTTNNLKMPSYLVGLHKSRHLLRHLQEYILLTYTTYT